MNASPWMNNLFLKIAWHTFFPKGGSKLVVSDWIPLILLSRHSAFDFCVFITNSIVTLLLSSRFYGSTLNCAYVWSALYLCCDKCSSVLPTAIDLCLFVFVHCKEEVINLGRFKPATLYLPTYVMQLLWQYDVKQCSGLYGCLQAWRDFSPYCSTHAHLPWTLWTFPLWILDMLRYISDSTSHAPLRHGCLLNTWQ